MKTIRIRLHGRVQKVGFRYHVAQQAGKFDIKGYVKNLADGSVEIVGQTSMPNKLIIFARECKRGPLLSKIDKAIEEDLPTAEEFDDFDIL